MRKIAFLVGSFHPDFSAVGYCAYQVQKCLTDAFAVHVLCYRTAAAQPDQDRLGAIHIQRVETVAMRRRNALNAQSGGMARARLWMHRARGAARRLTSPETVDYALVRAYRAALEAMDPPPQAIVPLVFPFESVIAALDYKRAHPDVVVIPYLFDDFVESGALHVLAAASRWKVGRHLRLEARMLAEADAVLSMHPLRAHFERHFSADDLAKVTYLEHPLLVAPPKAAATQADDVIRLCYTGALIRGVREPDYLLSLLQALRLDRPARADFFVMGNAASAVPTVHVDGGLRITNHGRVPKPDADAAVSRANVLLNIGERRGRQISSKVFEYIAAGKPIIHIAYCDSDAVTKVLAKYPLELCLVANAGDLRKNADLVETFIADKFKANFSFDVVKSIYPEALPALTACEILKIIDNREISIRNHSQSKSNQNDGASE